MAGMKGGRSNRIDPLSSLFTIIVTPLLPSTPHPVSSDGVGAAGQQDHRQRAHVLKGIPAMVRGKDD